MLRQFTIGLLAVLVACGAFGAEVGGIKIDDTITVAGQELTLNGAGVRTRAFFKVYVGSLYVPAKATSVEGVLAKSPRRIQLNLLRTLSADQLVDALVDGLKENSSAEEMAALKGETEQLVATMRSFGEVKEKDVVRLDFVDGATVVAFNGAAKSTIPGEAFNRALTKIWLGDKPVQADLKKAMLGG